MNDEELLRGLRGAARRADAKPTRTRLDAPLGAEFEARVAEQIASESRPAGVVRALRWIVPIAAAAAALVLWLARPRPTAYAPLPEYAMEVTGGVDVDRSAEPPARAEITARRSDTLTLVLRPPTDVPGPVEAHLFASHGRSPTEVPATTRVSASGSVELRAKVADIAPASEAVTSAMVVLTRPGLDPRALSPGAVAPVGTRVLPLVVHVVP
jgi:hypothetical protein